MKRETKQNLTYYYDFLVAYQNLLRDGGTFSSIKVQSTDNKLIFNNWPASQGEVAVVSKRFTNRDVLHLINFTNANSMEWRDTNGNQTAATTVSGIGISISSGKTVSKVWIASPDINGGVAQSIDFTQSGNEINLTVPSLKYWDMVVLEY